MDHGPSTEWGVDRSSSYKTRLGLWMFLVYSLVYASFVVINSVWPHLMAKPLGSTNVAIIYGFGLIGLALVMALIYNSLAGKAEEEFQDVYADSEDEEDS